MDNDQELAHSHTEQTDDPTEFPESLSGPVVTAVTKEDGDADSTAVVVGDFQYKCSKCNQLQWEVDSAVAVKGDFEYKSDDRDDDALAALIKMKEEMPNTEENVGRRLEVDRFIDEVHEATRKLTKMYPLLQQLHVEPFDVEDLVRTTERFMEARSNFSSDSRPIHVDIGYHYTDQSSLDSIRLNGLLNRYERVEKSLQFGSHNGSRYGEGVYTADMFYPYSEFGNTCLLVARLKGKEGPCHKGEQLVNDCTIVGHETVHEVAVLSRGYQCIPLLKFDNQLKTIKSWEDITEIIYRVHMELQEIIDKCFNSGCSTSVLEWRFDEYDTKRMTTRPTKAMAYTTLEFNDPQPEIEQQQSSFANALSPTRILAYHRKGINIAGQLEEASTLIPETMKVMFYTNDRLCCDGHSTLAVEYSLIDWEATCSGPAEQGSAGKEPSLSSFITYHPFTTSHCAVVRRLALAFEQGLLDSVLIVRWLCF